MAVEHGILDWSLPAAGDLSTKQFYGVQILTNGNVTTVATTLTQGIGILQDDPDTAGAACAVRVMGISKMLVDGSTNPIYPGYALGFATTGAGVAVPADNQYIIARALETSTAAADIISVLIITGGPRF